jgi:DNA-binding transcriptional LysR family regulator
MFNWDDLKHFLAFARKGSVLAAAKVQGVNHSTVYRRLADLEKRLGGRLIKRHLTGYRLTELGQGLLPYAERVEEAVAACERYLASCDEALTGTVRVTCSPTVGDRLRRTPLFETFHGRFPGLRIELVLSDRYVDLSKGEADIAIRSVGREIEDETLVGRKIAEGGWAVYASRAYIERHGRPDCPADIARHSVVKCDGIIAEHSSGRWLRAVAPHATVTACSESWPALVLAVKSGAGLAPLSTALGDGEGDLVRVIHNVPELVTHFYLLMHPDMQRVPRVRAFFDFVVSEVKAFRAVLSGPPEKQPGEAKKEGQLGENSTHL